MYRKITLLLVLIGVAIPLQAQEQNEEGGNSPSVEERLNVLEEEIERLRLEKATKQYEGHHGMGPAASEVYHIGEGLSWGGYGEVKYRDYRSKYKTDQTDVHRFILYAGYRFNDWILLNAEIEYEHAGFEEETVAGSTVNSGEVFVEFAYIDLQFTEWAQLALGLNLVPVGITNYRHEPTTFLPSERSQTESNIIPSTWREVGAILHGDIGSFMTYRTGIMTGPRGAKFSESSWIRGGRTKGSKARSEDFAYVLGLDFYPYEGWTVGGAYYMGDSGQREIAEINWTDRLSDPLSGSDTTGLKTALSDIRNNRHKDARVRVHIAEGHLEYDYGPVKMRALLARGWMNERDARA
ncbi:MAG: hypothetical protein KDK34_17175, partial [Leptospiraceae bacterium]|nr:hypothetical protein [Leptospiraceae bacterium]